MFIRNWMSPLHALVKAKQRRYFKTIWSERQHMQDDPLLHAIQLTLNSNTITSRFLSNLIHDDIDDIECACDSLRTSVEASLSPKVQLYTTLNPELLRHPVYKTKIRIAEMERISWSSLKLSAHSLAIEEGRWNRRGRGRLPVEDRLCRRNTDGGTRIRAVSHVLTDSTTIQRYIPCDSYARKN